MKENNYITNLILWINILIIILLSLNIIGVIGASCIPPEHLYFDIPFEYKKESIIQASDKSTVYIKLKNSYESPIMIEQINAKTDFQGVCTNINKESCIIPESYGIIDCNDPDALKINADNTQKIMNNKDYYIIIINCYNGKNLPIGERVKFRFNITWYPVNFNKNDIRTAEGELFSTVKINDKKS